MKRAVRSRIFLFVACITPWLMQSCVTTSRGVSTAPANPPSLRLYIFNCGENDVKDVSVFAPDVAKGTQKKMVVSCYLIQHPQGNLLWDSGLNDDLANNKDGVEANSGNFHLRLRKPFLSQLKEVGFKPSDMQFIAFSHFHADHVGNANAFSGSDATLLIQQEEYDAAFGPEPEKFRFEKSTYFKLKELPVLKLNGDHDVFGDGSVIIKRSIGHTPGHQALFVNLPKTGPVLLSGDLYHFSDNRTHKRVPIFNFDKEATLSSMDNIEKFVGDTNAQLWIQHDYEQNLDLRHAPNYYE